MTTILFSPKHQMMVADTRLVLGERIFSETYQKLWRRDECIIGYAGSTSDETQAVDNITHLINRPYSPISNLPATDGRALVWAPDTKIVYLYDHQSLIAFSDVGLQEPLAIGSGAEAALALLHAGIHPREVLQHVSRVDYATGGEWQHVAVGLKDSIIRERVVGKDDVQ